MFSEESRNIQATFKSCLGYINSFFLTLDFFFFFKQRNKNETKANTENTVSIYRLVFLLKSISTSVPYCHTLHQIFHQTVKSDRITMNFTLTQYPPVLHFIGSQPNLIRKLHSLLRPNLVLYFLILDLDKD